MVRSFGVAATLAALTLTLGCRESLDDDPMTDGGTSGRVCKPATTADCMEADNHADLAWIETNVFAKSCAFSGCHNGTATAAGRLDLKTAGASHADLVGVDSAIEPTRKLVVAGQPKQSYLLMMMQQFAPSEMEPTPVAAPPSDVGFMPQSSPGPVCCQKIDAIDRWIAAGALNN